MFDKLPVRAYHLSMTLRPPGWIDARELFAGAPKSTLAEWRGEGLLPEPIVEPLGRGRGRASYYPPGTDALFARLRQPGRATQDRDALIWDLWLDPAEYPVNMRRWVLKRIDRFLASLRAPEAPEIVAALKDSKRAAALIGTLPRRHPVRVILGNLKDVRALATLCSWALDIADERDPAVSLYDPQSVVLAALLKAFGLPTHFSRVPDKQINPEMLSLSYFGELIAKAREDAAGAGGEKLSQVRSDCRAIAALAEAAESVDWNAVSRTLDKNAAFLALTSTEPPSYRARRAERHAQRKNQLQPITIRTLLALWNNFGVRTAVVPGLIYIRGSSGHARSLAEIIALSHLALMQFPRRTNTAAEPER
jgi:hypothetical protein